MRAKSNLKRLQVECDAFNQKYKVGDEVILHKDSGDIRTKIEYPAEVLSGHSAVAWFEDVTGCYLISRVEPIKE